MSKRIGLLDKVFLAAETRESMMHVGALMLFQPPPGAPPDFLRKWMTELRDPPPIQSPWSLRLKNPDMLGSPRQRWVEDTEFDLDYHIRRSGLPTPGGQRELGVLVSRMHSFQMDFHRPLWEVNLIEGLDDGHVIAVGIILQDTDRLISGDGRSVGAGFDPGAEHVADGQDAGFQGHQAAAIRGVVLRPGTTHRDPLPGMAPPGGGPPRTGRQDAR